MFSFSGFLLIESKQIAFELSRFFGVNGGVVILITILLLIAREYATNRGRD